MRRWTKRSGAIAILAWCVALVVAARVAYVYYFDASFMYVPPGYSQAGPDDCTVGTPLYFGFQFDPTRGVHLTGAELVGVPASVDVEGVYAINTDGAKYPVTLVSDQQYWAKRGYLTAKLYPISSVSLPQGSMGKWWIVAKVVPRETGQNIISGINVSYESGWRSGSSFYRQEAGFNCSK